MPADGWPQLSLCYKTSGFPPDSTLGQQCAASCACMAASRHAPGSIKEGGGQTKCCAWQHQGRGGPETRSGTVHSLKCCPCQQKRAARLPSAAPGSIKRGGPETRSGTVQSLKCCPCQQKRAARLPAASRGGAPKRAPVPSRA